MSPRVFAAAVCLASLCWAGGGAAQTPTAAASRDAQALPSLAPLIDSIKAAVVNVDVRTYAHRGEGGDDGSEGEGLERFLGGGRHRPHRQQVTQGQGSGFIIDPQGLVITNNHVVEGAIEIRLRMEDGTVLDADVLGRDPLTDVALLKVRGHKAALPTVPLGDSDAMRVGDWVVAIGNPLGLASSVSVGIISARARNLGATRYDDFLQTDAAINPGNSGGPLFNTRGEAIGINTLIPSQGSGIGFSVPINMAKALLPQLAKEGSVTRGWLGISIQDLTADLGRAMGLSVTEGAIVGGVNTNSPAQAAGLHEDDVVVAVDGERVRSGAGLSRAVAFKRPGATATLTVFRSGKSQDVKVRLGTRPDIEGVGPTTAPARPVAAAASLGLQYSDLDPRVAARAGLPAHGALVTDVTPASPAERAELSHGMVVVEAGGKPILGKADLEATLKAAKPGTAVLLRVQTGDGRALRAIAIPDR
jgi:serine protease Do